MFKRIVEFTGWLAAGALGAKFLTQTYDPSVGYHKDKDVELQNQIQYLIRNTPVEFHERVRNLERPICKKRFKVEFMNWIFPKKESLYVTWYDEDEERFMMGWATAAGVITDKPQRRVALLPPIKPHVLFGYQAGNCLLGIDEDYRWWSVGVNPAYRKYKDITHKS